MQIFIRWASTHALLVSKDDRVARIKELLQEVTGVPSGVQRLQHGSRTLQDDDPISASSLEDGSTVQLLLRLRGGKGGFGALLRGAGRQALTDNTDACRDLNGRRLRHVNAEKKMAEWKAQAAERELEQLAEKHVKEREKTTQREEQSKVDIEEVRHAQNETLANVKSALRAGLSTKGAANKRFAGVGPTQSRKKQKVMALDLEDVSDSEEEVEEENSNKPGRVAEAPDSSRASSSCEHKVAVSDEDSPASE